MISNDFCIQLKGSCVIEVFVITTGPLSRCHSCQGSESEVVKLGQNSIPCLLRELIVHLQGVLVWLGNDKHANQEKATIVAVNMK